MFNARAERLCHDGLLVVTGVAVKIACGCLPTSVMIGRSDYFGLGFTELS